MADKMVACEMPKCDGELKEKRAEKTGFCINCAASMNMWKRRGIRAIMGRRDRLKKYDSRMALISEIKAVPDQSAKIDRKKEPNAQSIRRAKQKALQKRAK